MLLALACPRIAAACPVEVQGSDALRWQTVALEAQQAWLPAAADCPQVVVNAEARGTTLRLSAGDGRLALRQLREPTELLPALQALTVEGPAEPAHEGKPEPPVAAAVAALPRAEPPIIDAVERSPSDPYALRPLLGASLGFRLGADRLISPTLGANASIVNGHLELGLLARYEAHYVNSTGGNEGRPDTSGLGFGVQVGAHHAFSNWALRGGLTFLIAALHEDAGGKNGRAEARIGVFGGAVWPAQNRLRFRGDLAFELVPYNVGRSETNALGSTSLPWWGCSLSLGLEYG